MPDTPSWADASVPLIIELIRNACVNTGDPDSGHEMRSVETIQRFMDDDGTVVEPHPGRGSVIYTVEGFDPDAPSVLLIPHLDVVPANPAEWTHPPFEAVVDEGFVWGRGAVDMLNVTAAMVTIVRAMRTGDLPRPAGNVVLAAVADEEAGGTYGAEYLIEHHWDLVGCDVVLTEVAGPTLPGPSLPVTVAEKGPAWRRVSAHGIAGHGSQPYARSNAVLTLAEAFHRIGEAPQPVLITEEWRVFVPHLPVDDGLKARLLDEDTVDAAIDEIAAVDPTLARWIHACTHLTLSPNVFQGGSKSNVVPDQSTGDVDVRLLPGQESADIDDHLRKILGPDLFEELELEPVLEMQANGSPAEGPMWEAIADAAEAHLGSRSLAPTLTPVTTDARFFRDRGIPAYGVGLFDDSVTFPEMLAMFHGADERVSVRSVIDTTAFLATVLEAFSTRVSS